MRIALFNDTRSDHDHFGCALVVNNFLKLIDLAGGDVVFFWPFDRDWRDHVDELPKKGEIDAIIVNAEGSMHGAPHRQRAVALSELGTLAKERYGVPAFLINGTFYNNDEAFHRKLTQFDLVYSRDRESQTALQLGGVAASVCHDLTLALPHEASGIERKGIGVTDSVHRKVDLKLRKFARSVDAEFTPMVNTELPAFSVALLQRPSHLRNWLRSRRREKEFGKDTRPDSPGEFVDWIASKELVVTGRYHTVTLCLLTQTPFIYVESNTPKITALVRDVGLNEKRRMDVLPVASSEELVTAYAFDDAEREAVERFVAQARMDNSAMMRTIVAAISGA